MILVMRLVCRVHRVFLSESPVFFFFLSFVLSTDLSFPGSCGSLDALVVGSCIFPDLGLKLLSQYANNSNF